ncbi:hypothetical protein PV327_010369 [Microctonus hyperodae]|uniref:Uncharacterized protein n=1 Tax=Microctonus hyperodae TaxID=165561 RepID=A0AA39KUZ2_MICHY|nr:hypothetical protein PV327_010369 [Microctonus hyperodae]
MAAATGAGNSTGVTWWAMMNGGVYEESPPPLPPAASSLISIQHQQQQQTSTPGSLQQATTPTSPSAPSSAATATAPAQAASASSTSPSASSVTSNSAAGPLHIPAKRLTATPVGGTTYGEVNCVEAPGAPGATAGVIRHSHSSSGGSQGGWSYSPHNPQDTYHSSAATADSLNHHQAYGGTNPPTYYNLADSGTGSSRDTRKSGSALSFWSPATASAGPGTGGGTTSDYKSYNPASAGGTVTSSAASSGPIGADPAVSTCHQSFPQSWCNYPPYASTRHHHPVDTVSHHHPHSQAGVPYLTPSATEDRGRVAAMVAAESAFPHDGYGGLRNYAPEPVTSSPYPTPVVIYMCDLCCIAMFISVKKDMCEIIWRTPSDIFGAEGEAMATKIITAIPSRQ